MRRAQHDIVSIQSLRCPGSLSVCVYLCLRTDLNSLKTLNNLCFSQLLISLPLHASAQVNPSRSVIFGAAWSRSTTNQRRRRQAAIFNCYINGASRRALSRSSTRVYGSDATVLYATDVVMFSQASHRRPHTLITHSSCRQIPPLFF